MQVQKGMQQKVMDAKEQLVFCGGQRGSGATTAMLIDASTRKGLSHSNLLFYPNREDVNPAGFKIPQIESIFHETMKHVKETNKPHFTNTEVDYYQSLAHVEYRIKGGEYDFIGIDNINEITPEVFNILNETNRNCVGHTNKIVATCYKTKNHWTGVFLNWYYDMNNNLIPERNGVTRFYYVHNANHIITGSSVEEVLLKAEPYIDFVLKKMSWLFDCKREDFVRSYVFHSGVIDENVALKESDPSFVGNITMSSFGTIK